MSNEIVKNQNWIVRVSLGLWVMILMAFFTTSQVMATEEFDSIDVQIQLSKNGSLEVEERIVFSTTEPRHGIYRIIPSTLVHDTWKIWRTPLKLVSVTDGEGGSIPFTQEKNRGKLEIKIGDADKTFTGAKEYLIRYQVDRAIWPSDSPEFSWDIPGDSWQFPIGRLSATIKAADNVTFADPECVKGAFGSDTPCRVTGSPKMILLDFTSLGVEETTTITTKVDGLELGYSPIWDQLWLMLLVLPFGAAVGLWWWGRDFAYSSANLYQPGTVIKRASLFDRHPTLVSEPIREMTPAMVGLIRDKKIDNRDLIAEIIELVRLGHLSIEKLPKQRFRKQEYQLTVLESQEKLTDYQRSLLNGVGQVGTSVKMSQLKGKFYLAMNNARAKLASAAAPKWFTHNPSTTAGLGMVGVFAAHILVFIGLAMILPELLIGLSLVVLVVSAVVSLILVRFLARRSAEGHRLYQLSRGLEYTIKKGAWRQKVAEKQLFIERVLPLAIALGVVEKLAKDMEGLGIEPPSYLAAVAGSTSWSRELSSFSSDAASSLAYNPSSGSSSSGGGSAGGGGGGGGGGSW